MHNKQWFCAWIAGDVDHIFQTQGGPTSWSVCDPVMQLGTSVVYIITPLMYRQGHTYFPIKKLA